MFAQPAPLMHSHRSVGPAQVIDRPAACSGIVADSEQQSTRRNSGSTLALRNPGRHCGSAPDPSPVPRASCNNWHPFPSCGCAWRRLNSLALLIFRQAWLVSWRLGPTLESFPCRGQAALACVPNSIPYVQMLSTSSDMYGLLLDPRHVQTAPPGVSIGKHNHSREELSTLSLFLLGLSPRVEMCWQPFCTAFFMYERCFYDTDHHTHAAVRFFFQEDLLALRKSFSLARCTNAEVHLLLLMTASI